MASDQTRQNVADIVWRSVQAAGATGSPAARQDVYRLFRRHLATRIAAGKAPLAARAALDAAVRRIEEDLAFWELAHSAPPPALEEERNAGPPLESAAAGARPRLARPITWLMGALLCVALAIAAFLPLQPAADQMAAGSIHAIDLARLTLDPAGTHPAAGEPGFAVREAGPRTAVVTGPLNLHSGEPIAVDTGRRYELGVRLRVLPGPDGTMRSTRLFAGMATFDQEGVLQTAPPGSHRYALLNDATISSDEGWIERRAVVSGVGNERVDQFRKGAATIKLVVLANYKSDPATQVEIASLYWRLLPD